MGRVIANLFASLDGFAVDRDVEMRWVTDNYGKDKEKFVHDAHHSMDVMLLGRVTYEELAEYWPNASVEEEPLADRMNSIPKVVFSKTLEEPLAWSNATLARGDLADEVSALKRRPGKEIGIVGSVTGFSRAARALRGVRTDLPEPGCRGSRHLNGRNLEPRGLRARDRDPVPPIRRLAPQRCGRPRLRRVPGRQRWEVGRCPPKPRDAL